MAWGLQKFISGTITTRMPFRMGKLLAGGGNAGSTDSRVPNIISGFDRSESNERPKFIDWNNHQPSKLLFVDSAPKDLSPDHIEWYEFYSFSNNLINSDYDKQLRNHMMQANKDKGSVPLIIMSPDAVNLERATYRYADNVQQIFNVYSKTVNDISAHTERQWGDFVALDVDAAKDVDKKITDDKASLNNMLLVPIGTLSTAPERVTKYLIPSNADGKHMVRPIWPSAEAEIMLSERVLSINKHEKGHYKKLYSDHPNPLINDIKDECFADAYSILTTAQSTGKIDASELSAEKRARGFSIAETLIQEKIAKIKSEETDKNTIIKRCHNEIFKDMVHLTQPVADKAVEVTMDLLASGKLEEMTEKEIIELADNLTIEHSFTEKQVLEIHNNWLNNTPSKTIDYLKQRGKIARKRLMVAEENPKSVEPVNGSYSPPEMCKCYILKNLAKIEGKWGKIQFLIDIRDEIRAATDDYPELEGTGHFATPKSPDEFNALVTASEEYIKAAQHEPNESYLELSGKEALKSFINLEKKQLINLNEMAAPLGKPRNDESKANMIKIEQKSQDLASIVRNDPDAWEIVEQAPELARVINAKAAGLSPRCTIMPPKKVGEKERILKEDMTIIEANEGLIEDLMTKAENEKKNHPQNGFHPIDLMQKFISAVR